MITAIIWLLHTYGEVRFATSIVDTVVEIYTAWRHSRGRP